jgi:hypothetical protein
MRTYRKRAGLTDARVEVGDFELALQIDRAITKDAYDYAVGWRRRGRGERPNGVVLSHEVIDDLPGVVEAVDWRDLRRLVIWSPPAETLFLFYEQGPSYVVSPAPVADQANAELERLRYTTAPYTPQPPERTTAKLIGNTVVVMLGADADMMTFEERRKLITDALGPPVEARKPVPAIAAEPEFTPPAELSPLLALAQDMQRRAFESMGVPAQMFTVPPPAIRQPTLEERVRYYGGGEVRHVPAMAFTICKCGDVTCNGCKPAPVDAAGVYTHLAEKYPGRAGMRAVCGRTLGGIITDNMRTFLDAGADRCMRCESLHRGRQAERSVDAGAVASAPAARPQLSIACQSQYDPDD